MRYLLLEEILQAHEQLLSRYGGTSGIRDQGLLESAILRPHATVFGREAYASIFDKSAAVCHSLLLNHPFIDGNKRTAFAACHLMLLINGLSLVSSPQETYDFLIQIIKKHSDWQEISLWLKKNSRKISSKK